MSPPPARPRDIGRDKIASYDQGDRRNVPNVPYVPFARLTHARRCRRAVETARPCETTAGDSGDIGDIAAKPLIRLRDFVPSHVPAPRPRGGTNHPEHRPAPSPCLMVTLAQASPSPHGSGRGPRSGLAARRGVVVLRQSLGRRTAPPLAAQAAGDLFDDDEDWADAALAKRLGGEKLTVLMNEVRAEGWKEVKFADRRVVRLPRRLRPHQGPVEGRVQGRGGGVRET